MKKRKNLSDKRGGGKRKGTKSRTKKRGKKNPMGRQAGLKRQLYKTSERYFREG